MAPSLLAAAVLTAAAILVAGCGRTERAGSRTTAVTPSAQTSSIPPALLAAARPIGRGPRFEPPVGGDPTGACTVPLGQRDQAHIEVFARDRVVLLAAGIGARGPRRLSDGRLTSAACFGDAVTLDPTGTVYFRPGETVTLGDLFAAWGQPLSRGRIASFTGPVVRIYVDGRRRSGPAVTLALTPNAEIVLEIGPYVPPHHSFTFPTRPSARLP